MRGGIDEDGFIASTVGEAIEVAGVVGAVEYAGAVFEGADVGAAGGVTGCGEGDAVNVLAVVVVVAVAVAVAVELKAAICGCCG